MTTEIKNYQSLLQVLGQNAEAQKVLTAAVTAAFPELQQKYSLDDIIIAKFYNWAFPFRYTSDGGGKKLWGGMVRAWCMRNAALKVLDDTFSAIDGKGLLKEEYGGSDVTAFEDGRESVNKAKYNALGSRAAGLSDETTAGFTDGKNTTKTTYTRGTSRTYTDGRSAEERISDLAALVPPVYNFINGFAGLLCPPADFEVKKKNGIL